MFALIRIFALILSLSTLPGAVNALGLYEVLPEDLLQAIETGSQPLIIDVREAEQYRLAHIPQAINIEHTAIRKQLDTLKSHKNNQVIVYCGDGTRSAIAMTILRKEGFNQVLNLHGNFYAWQARKLPTESTPSADQ